MFCLNKAVLKIIAKFAKGTCLARLTTNYTWLLPFTKAWLQERRSHLRLHLMNVIQITIVVCAIKYSKRRYTIELTWEELIKWSSHLLHQDLIWKPLPTQMIQEIIVIHVTGLSNQLLSIDFIWKEYITLLEHRQGQHPIQTFRPTSMT